MNLKVLFLILIVLPLISFFGSPDRQASASAGESNLKLVALTFDDGPNPKFLEKALPYFQKENIKATFFVIGNQAKINSDWLVRLTKEGHEVENHTLNHICLAKPGPKWTGCPNIPITRSLNEVKLASEIIERYTGRKPMFLRPPYFAMNSVVKKEIENTLNIKVLSHDDRFSIGSLDWVYKDSEKIANRVINRLSQIGDGSHLVVFHENEITLKALPIVVDYLKKRGYEFVTLEELAKLNPKTKLQM